MNKVKTTVIVFLFVFVLLSQGWTIAHMVPGVEARDVEWKMEGFIDLVGRVNYTYDPTGQNYTPFFSNAFEIQNDQIDFALSIGPRHVYYWIDSRTGQPIKAVDEIYAWYASPVLLWEAPKTPQKTGIANVNAAEYTPNNDNLTVDNLDETSIADNEIKPIDMLGGNSSAVVSTSLIHNTIDSRYSSNYKRLIDFDDTDVLYEEPKDAKELGALGTNNMTETIYSWLARYIEEVKGFEPYTVMIDANTENITSEALTVAMDDKTAQSIQELIDTTLAEEGAGYLLPPVLDTWGLGNIGPKIASRISTKGTFAFARGIGLSALKGGATIVRSYAKVANTVGGMATKAVISAAVSVPRTIKAFGDLTYRASAKTTRFFTDASGKLAKTKFSFLAGPIKFIGKTVSILIKYWWLFLGLFGLGFIMFATPVGPFIMNSTIRKWSR